MDLSTHHSVLTKYDWNLEHEFSDQGRFYIHPEIEGEILIQPEGQWEHTLFDFAHEKKLGHGYNAKDLEKYLSNYKTEKKRKSKSERLINLIKMIEIQEDFFGTEIVPYLLDALEEEIDIDTKEKAIRYMEDLTKRDKYTASSLSYLRTLNDEEYLELLDFVKKEYRGMTFF